MTRGPRNPWLGGGTAGNEQLTAATGIVLIVVLAAVGVTIIRIGQLLWLHLFLGLLVIGPVALKMASTGYRFLRYYARDRPYRRKGPPEIWLRLIAPIIVVSTVVVLVTGVVLLFGGPELRDPLVLIHKVAFIVWVAFTSLHLLGHLAGLTAAWRTPEPDQVRLLSPDSGGPGRLIALVGALVGGAVLAIALIPDFSAWTAHAGLLHHHRG